jgi:prevent-host-death family protein
MPRATDIMPITEFTRAYQKVIKQLRKNGRPKVLTVDGKPAVVVQDAAAFDRLFELVDAEYVREAIRTALADTRPGIPLEELHARIAALKQRAAKPRSRKRPAA